MYERLVQSLSAHCGLRLKPGSEIVDVRQQPAEFLGIEIDGRTAKLSGRTLEKVRLTAERLSEVKGRGKALDYLKHVRNSMKSIADVSSIDPMLNRFRTPKAPTDRSVAVHPACTPPGGPLGLSCTTASGASAQGGGGHVPPPPVVQRSQFSSRRKRKRYFPNGDRMLWQHFPLSPDQAKNVNIALEVAAHLTESKSVGHLLDMICLEFNGAHVREREDREIMLNRMCARIDEIFGVNVVVVDPRKKEIVYGGSLVADDVDTPVS